MMRETLRNANQNKTTRTAGYKKEPFKNHSEKNSTVQNARKSKTTKMKFS